MGSRESQSALNELDITISDLEKASSSFEQQSISVEIEQPRSKLQDTFCEQFPGGLEPNALLGLIEKFGGNDTPGLLICMQLVYPEVVSARDNLITSIDYFCSLISKSHVKNFDSFWGPFVRECSRSVLSATKRCKLRCDPVTYSNGITTLAKSEEALRAIEHEWEKYKHTLGPVQEQLGVFDSVEEDTTTLITRVQDLVRHYANELHRVQGELMGPLASPLASSNASLLQSPTAALLLQTTTNRNLDSHSAAKAAHPAIFTSSPRSTGPQHSKGVGRDCTTGSKAFLKYLSAWVGTIATRWRNAWSGFGRLSFKEKLGHSMMVWNAVIALAIAGGVATALAIWLAGPNAPIPQIDGNFWSNLSQNLVALAGLYCIIIPMLRNAGVGGTESFRFRFCLIGSGVGALFSTAIYPVQLRTSMILAYLSSLLQLLATLLILENAATKVTTIREENIGLAVEGDRLFRENDMLENRVHNLEDQLAAERQARPR